LRNLYTNGCSYVWGDELEDRRDAFPHLLKTKLGCELTDDSKCGSDNQRIMRTTLTADLKNHFVIIGWASIIRYEYYDKSYISEGIDLVPGWESNIGSRFEKYPEIHKYFEYDWFVVNFLNQVLVLQNYLKYNNIPFFFFMSYPMYKDQNVDYLEHFDLIDESTFPSLFNEDLEFFTYCKNNGLNDFMPNWHPSPRQHKLWSEYLYEKINTNNNFTRSKK
tara:strand:- start:117 stop:776 length:660 start_codon:yes stop_codon:yes gene_type:complete